MKRISAKSLFVNALTFSRVPLIFAYLALAVAGHFSDTYAYSLAACVLAAAAGFSDFFDGLLARRWGVVSDFGKMADPLMDKVYFIMAFPSLVWLAAVQGESAAHAVTLLVFTVLWILRDQWVTFLRAVASLYHADVAAMWLGKVRTALSFPCAGFIYIYLAFHRSWPSAAERAGFFACFAIEGFLILLNLYSFIVYTRSYFPYIRRAVGHDEDAHPKNGTVSRPAATVATDSVSRARQAAVAAVEARVAEEMKKHTAKPQSRTKGCLTWLFPLLLLAAAGGYFACRHYGIGLNEVKMRIHETVKECFPSVR